MPDWLLQLAGVFAGAAGAYAAIRADLAALHVKADNATAVAARAHDRIDQMHAWKG